MESKKAAVLKARADVLTVPLKEARQENILEVLKFFLNGELFAIELRFVLEVSLLKEYTKLPGTPPFIYGLMNMRRLVLPIIDLSELFGVSKQEKALTEKVIILKESDVSFALCTEGIIGVEAIPISSIQPPPSTLSGIQTEFLRGITTAGIVLLDGEKLIHAKQLIIDED